MAFFELIKPNTKIDFVGMIRYTLALSWIVILIGIVSLVVKGGPTYGIDFRGGTLFQVKFTKQVSASDIRQMTVTPAEIVDADRAALRDAGFDDRSIWDIAAVAAFFNLSNRMATAVDMMPNLEYHAKSR